MLKLQYREKLHGNLLKQKVAIAKLVYGRRYQWEVEEGWGKVSWLDAQDMTGGVQESTW